MVDLLQQLKEIADVIIFDSPPVLAVTDAVVLSSRVDGIILVTKAKHTRRNAVRQTIEKLEHVGGRVLGSVLNQVSQRGDYGSYAYYTRGGGRTLATEQLDESKWRRLRQRLLVLK